MAFTRVTPESNQLPVKVVGSSAFGRYPKINAEKTYNMFITTGGEGDSEERWLVNFAGYQRALTLLPAGQCRALYNVIRGNFLIAVVNDTVFQILPSFQVVNVGNLSTTSGEVFIADNLSQQVCFVDGTNAYISFYTDTTISPPVIQTDGALSGSPPALIPNYVEYHNTYFLFGNGSKTATGSQWYAYSRNADTGASAITQSAQLALQTKADFAIAVKRLPGLGNNVIVFGETVAEIWTQVPGTQVYERNPTKNIDYGCISVATIGEGDNYIAWLAVNADDAPVILTYDGNNQNRISTDGIDYQLSQVKHPEQSTAILYRTDGHLFYQLTFFNTEDNLTFLYDFTTNLFFNLSDQALNYHPARQIVYFNLKQYFCSLNNGSLYELSSNITNINENLVTTTNPDPNLIYAMQRIRVTPSIREQNSTRFIANSLVLTLEQGTDPNFIGIPTADIIITESTFSPSNDPIVTELGSVLVTEDSVSADDTTLMTVGYYAPRIDLALSKDGGMTWSNYVSRTLHPLGYRKNILHWEGMGVANDLCFKFRFWGTYRFVVNQAMADIRS